jgi:hypothetical protein
MAATPAVKLLCRVFEVVIADPDREARAVVPLRGPVGVRASGWRGPPRARSRTGSSDRGPTVAPIWRCRRWPSSVGCAGPSLHRAGIWFATWACSGRRTGSAPSSARWCPRAPPSQPAHRRRAASTGMVGSRGPSCCAGCSLPLKLAGP